MLDWRPTHVATRHGVHQAGKQGHHSLLSSISSMFLGSSKHFSDRLHHTFIFMPTLQTCMECESLVYNHMYVINSLTFFLVVNASLWLAGICILAPVDDTNQSEEGVVGAVDAGDPLDAGVDGLVTVVICPVSS